MTFNVQQPKLTASADKHNVNIISIQQHRCYHCELELKYYDTVNGWTSV